jgi:ribosomal protein S18 acetylase RimI-like enzyme
MGEIKLRIENGQNQHEIIAYDGDNNILGKGYIYPSLSSDLYEKERYDIFIEMEVVDEDENDKIKTFIFNGILDRANKFREEHKDYEVRVYHCCFSDNQGAIDFYTKQEGFKHDEGMYIIQHTLATIPEFDGDINDFEIVEDALNTEEEVRKFVEAHRKIFIKDPYTFEKVMDFKKEEDFRGILVLQEGRLVGASLLYVIKEDEIKIGWVEDMFISKEWRRNRLGYLLMIKNLNYFKSIGVDKSRLEVWSANQRALNLYYKVGYQLLKESEISIGKFI